MKPKSRLLLLAAFSSLALPAQAAAVITYLGAETNATTVAAWRSTSVAKNATFDVDGDNAYGTAGYAIPKTSVATGSTLTTSNWDTGLPGFVTLTASSGNIWHAEVYPDIDNPALAIGATVGNITNPPSTYGTPTVTFTLNSAQDFVFSVLTNHNTAGQGPGTLTLTGPGGATASVTNTSTLVGIWSFDLKGFQANDTFTLTATTSGAAGGKFTAVAFDVIPEPSAALLGCLSLLALLRRRR